MSSFTAKYHKIANFFEEYALALESYDAKKMTQFYALPCTFLSDEATDVFTQASNLEGLFNQGIGFYKQFGITNVRPDVWSKRAWTDRIVKVKLNWQYFDKNNQPVYNCDYQYVLRLDKNDNWKIEVAISINEKERMEEWMKKNEKTKKGRAAKQA